jgi:hypothetical protein
LSLITSVASFTTTPALKFIWNEWQCAINSATVTLKDCFLRKLLE